MATTTERPRDKAAAGATMKALRFHAAKDLRIENVARPGAPGPGQVLVKNRFVKEVGRRRWGRFYVCGPILEAIDRPLA